jgi:deazaflavin-dependent oxidoreductase (nitroreductase family)
MIAEPLISEPFCYLTTIGRRTGRPHTIEIWFAATADGRTLYLLAQRGKKSDWVRNLVAHSDVRVRVADQAWEATARPVTDPDEARRARELVCARNEGWVADRPLPTWAVTALPVALDLSVP